jgi:microsomal dipeptidase-like Zn-dependent dipeptidase
MKKSDRASAPESSRSQWLERLTDAVNHLAQELRVVRDVMDEIREDLGWITRNGIPGRHGEHTQIVRMARDPLSPDANERLATQKTSAENSPSSFDELVAEIAEAVTVVGQEHVNLLLTALDDARAKLLAAIKTPSAEPKPTTAVATEQPAPAVKPPTASKPGQLF